MVLEHTVGSGSLLFGSHGPSQGIAKDGAVHNCCFISRDVRAGVCQIRYTVEGERGKEENKKVLLKIERKKLKAELEKK